MNLKKSMIRGLAMYGASSMISSGHANAKVLADLAEIARDER